MLNIRPYAHALLDSDEMVRCEALSALLSKGVSNAVPLFLQAAHDPSPKVREMAVSGLGRFTNPVAIPVLLEALEDPEDRVCAEAAYALCQFRDARSLDGILHAMERLSPFDRVVVLMGLAYFPHKRFFPALEKALSDPLTEVRNAARAVLDQHKDFYNICVMQTLVPALDNFSSWVAYEQRFQDILDTDPDTGVEKILSILKRESDPENRILMIRALGCLHDPSNLIPLIQCSEDAEPEVRRAAIDELGHLDDELAHEVVERALSDPAEQVRAEALLAYSRKNESGLVIHLERMLQMETSDRVRETILYKLARHDYLRARSYLRADLHSERKDMRLRAAVLLAEHQDHDAKSILWNALDDCDEWARALAIHGLGKLGDQAVLDRLVEALQDSDSKVRVAAAESLGHLGDEKALAPLRAALYDVYPAVREAVSESLARLENQLRVVAS